MFMCLALSFPAFAQALFISVFPALVLNFLTWIKIKSGFLFPLFKVVFDLLNEQFLLIRLYQINLATSFAEVIACHPLAGSLESPIVKISPLKSEFEISE